MGLQVSGMDFTKFMSYGCEGGLQSIFATFPCLNYRKQSISYLRTFLGGACLFLELKCDPEDHGTQSAA